MAVPWAAIASVGSSLLGGLFGKSGAEKQNAAQIQSAREQMDFQERMSNTAHQREIKDLEAAGLNPMLSAKLGGASSPGGAQPNIVNTMAPLENSARSVSDKAFAYTVQREQVNNMKLQNDLLKTQIEQGVINNARTGLTTPAWEAGGRLMDKAVPLVEKLATRLLGGPDIVQEVIDASNKTTGGLIPQGSSAKNFDWDFEIPVGTKGSGARDYANGRKSFLQSFKDANTKPKELTEEALKAYGMTRLEELRRKHGFMKRK